MPRLLELQPAVVVSHVRQLAVRPAAPGESVLVKTLIHNWHRTLPNSPAGYRVAFLITDRADNVYGVATWGRPVARHIDQQKTLELTRYAISSAAPRNTATYGLARMRAWVRSVMPEVTRLVSYQDCDEHHGTIYRADNWTLAEKPSRSAVRGATATHGSAPNVAGAAGGDAPRRETGMELLQAALIAFIAFAAGFGTGALFCAAGRSRTPAEDNEQASTLSTKQKAVRVYCNKCGWGGYTLNRNGFYPHPRCNYSAIPMSDIRGWGDGE